MEVILGIATKIAQLAVEPVGHCLSYSFRFSSNIENMQKQEGELMRAKDRVKHSVNEAKRNAEEIEADVEGWLKDVDVIIENTGKFRAREEESDMRCSIWAWLHLKRRHQLSHEAEKIVKDIGELLKNGNFGKVSYRPASQWVETMGNTDCFTWESRMSVAKGLMEALGNPNISMIGVWGMPGVGKSTLMKEVARQAKEEKLFNEVAMATVTESPDLRRIQGEIADMLDLKFDQETETGRAHCLRRRLLTKDEKILVILDDLWEKIDLEAIGIPSKGCKVVLTSRNRDVLVSEMDTQNDFRLEILEEEEACILFEKIAGDSVKDPRVRSVATEVAIECAGLPIAIVTVSKALRNKNLCEWNDALIQLRRPTPEHVPKMLSTVYSRIELSYNLLESQELKSLFLLCAQIDHFIFYLDLFKYCYGLGIFYGMQTLEDARNRLHTLLRNLKDLCLLLESPYSSEEYLLMHDVVRDVATLIASKDHNMLVMRDDGGLKKWPDVDTLERCEAFSIHGGDIHQLPTEVRCPKLRFFYVDGRDRSLQISDSLFSGMKKLKVLDLTDIELPSLPSSLLLLENLQTLCLDHCVLGDISGIGNLKNLIVLSLIHSDISKLPIEIGSLTRLRLLDLSNCSKLEVIPPNVLSSLVELEELRMGNSFVQWEVEGLDNERKNASLTELEELSHLTTLEIQIPDASNLPKEFLLFEKLKRYTIYVGDVWDWSDNQDEASMTLKIKLRTSFESEVGIKTLLKKTENLYLDELNGVKSVLYELDSAGFQQLKNLHIQNNAEIEHIINWRMSVVAFPSLETFILKNMISLEEICHGQLPSSTSFHNLRVVKVERCHKLKFVFTSFIARGLSLLEELEIRECNIMGAIVVKEEGEIEDGDMILFPRLQILVLEHLPKLMSVLRTQNSFVTDAGEIISEGNLNFNMPLLHDQVAFPSLKTLIISHMDDLKIIWHNQFTANSFCKLQTLKVESCANLISIFQCKMLKILQSLETLFIVDCGSLEEVFNIQGLSFQETHAVIATRLKELDLIGLPKLKHIWNKDPRGIFSFQNLLNVNAEECGSLKSLFPASVATTLTQLKFLEVYKCGVELIVEKEGGAEAAARLVFPNLTILSLTDLPKLKCFSPGAYTPEWPLLKQLQVLRCDQVKIFGSKFSSFQEKVQQNQLETDFQQPLFVVEEVTFPNLEILTLELNHAIWPSQFLEELFCRLKFLGVRCDDNRSALSPSTFLRRLQNLDELFVWNSCWEEIFPYEELVGREMHARIVPQLKELTLYGLPMLTHLWKEDTQPCPILHTLENLKVSLCPKLTNLVSSSVSFQKLTNLEILNCRGLIDLVTFSTAKSLVQLKKMSISQCKSMTEIVAKEDGEAKVVITFSKLAYIKLDCLPNLTNFCSGNYSFVFPSLEKVIVRQCPEMKTFCQYGGLCTPKLERVQATKEDESHWKVDLNTTIHWIWEGKL